MVALAWARTYGAKGAAQGTRRREASGSNLSVITCMSSGTLFAIKKTTQLYTKRPVGRTLGHQVIEPDRDTDAAEECILREQSR